MADSILIEGNMWSNDPIHGALGHVLTLNNQIQSVQRELQLVNTMLSQCSLQTTSHVANTVVDDVVAGSSHIGQSSNPIPPHEKEGAAQEKDDEVKRKNKRKH
ncbi:Lateral organ boundary [Vigna unguiculata]|uniref:Lateral organ boundary n=1 Tax=Vigna unguiculata TaxID=3917 RepID=A0A4D6LBM0_VIGUN|nr:Lateral organ boundary [Vigna unguiculata]